MFFLNLHFLSHNIDDRFSALIFTELNPNLHPLLESAFGIRIPDADPGDQNHADSCGYGCRCGCGSATLVLIKTENNSPLKGMSHEIEMG
jgi:hypothetical protein